MTAPTLLSPNTGNYRVGKGALWFKRDGDVDYKHMGNATTFEFTPSVDKLDHFSSMEGVKEKDASIVLTRGGTVHIVLDEWTPANLSLALLGSVDEGASGGPTVEVLDTDAVSGALKFISNNDAGPRWNAYYHNVSFIPSAAINPISDEWGQIEIEGEALVSQTAPNVGKFGYWQLTNLDS
jgi:hypothetical protein